MKACLRKAVCVVSTVHRMGIIIMILYSHPTVHPAESMADDTMHTLVAMDYAG